MPSFNQLSKGLGRTSYMSDFEDETDEDRYYYEICCKHVARECSGDCDYCVDEELEMIYRYMYKGFVEQYGPRSVYDFMLVKKELFDYFEQKYYQQHADKYKQIMAELVFRWQSCR
jgi:hypothetical protein